MIDVSQIGTLPVEEKRELLKSLLSLQSSDSTGLAPLSYGQLSLWFIYQLAPTSPAYNFLYAARIQAPLDLGVFRRACRLLLERHPLLRTRFVVQDHKPLQQVNGDFALDINITDASSWTEEHLIEVLRQQADLPFDLTQAPCLRIELFQTAPAQVVLLLVIPHIIADLWSADLLLQELAQIYACVRDRRPVDLPNVGARFVDFVRWQMVQTHGESGQKSKAYWHNKLAGELPVLDLPTRQPRPPVQTYNGAAYTWTLPPELVQQVRTLAGAHRTTPFMTLLAAFQLLLHRLSGQDDILIGSVVAGRDRPEWERVVGYFLNQVVFRTRFTGRTTFHQWLEQTRDQVYQALDHQAYPFGLLVKQLQPKRDPSRPPIFQVMFIWDKPRHLDAHAQDDRGLPLETVLMEQRGAPFDLSFIVYELGDRLVATFRYNTDLFDAAAVQRWAECFNTLLDALARTPNVLICEAPLLSPAERQRLLVDWNRTATVFPQGSFLDLFEGNVRHAPEAPALCFGETTLSYDQVNRRANLVARYLQSRGVRPGSIVALSLPRSLDMIIAIMGVWKAGGVYLFLDPLYPPKRRDDISAEAQPVLVLAAEDLATMGAFDDSNLGWTAAPEDRAYIIYTSGSTGQPKGALLRHGGLINLARAKQQALQLQPGDRLVQFASFSFDASIWEIVGSLGEGATLVLGSQAELLPGRPLWNFLRDRAITCATLPPSIVAMLPAEPLPALRTLVVAGEACSTELINTWAPGRRFINAYGPTEVTVCSTLTQCFANAPGPVTIGKPIANIRAYVLDRDLEPVPVGVSGELYLAGRGLAEGYLNRPDLTAERFLPNPFDAADEGLIYRTGDLVRWTPAGALEFLGRVDQQVKIRGCRIELEEIQGILRRHPDIQDAVVVVRPGAHETPELVGYVIPRAGANLSLAALRGFLREHLPHYMLPGTLVPLDAFPFGPTGKVDRARLPAPPVVDSVARATPAAPAQTNGTARTPMERMLLQIWTRVLMVDHVGPHDNFFDLGGASTQTLEVVDLAREQGLTLSPDMIFRYQTVAELARSLEKHANGTPASQNADAPPTPCATPARTTCQAAAPVARQTSTSELGSVVESLGAYLPEQVVTTDQLVQGCRTKLDFPLERMTGIRSRRVAGAQEFSIDLAMKAAAECLRRSVSKPADIDLVICCNISRLDGPMYQFSMEPSSAARICQRFGLVNALSFDITNACAGTFTAIMIVDSFIRQGLINRGMVVSGEFITHLSRTAQQEITGYMDPRMACLTLGDSGVAMILDRATRAGTGFQDIELYTLGKYHDLCVAKLSTVAGSGPIMHTDAVTATTVTIKQAVSHAVEVLRRKQWDLDKVDALIVHQTSETTLDGAVREINRALGKTMVHRGNTVYNVAERGNTATNTHFLAVWERILAGDFKAGDRAVFAVSGSGQTVGTALYVFDDLPERLRRPPETPSTNGHASATNGTSARSKPPVTPAAARSPLRHFRTDRRVRIASIGTLDRAGGVPADTVAMVCQAGQACLQQSSRPRNEIDLVLHTGIYHSEFISEPAIAAIAAGNLAINHDESLLTGRRTLAFDVLNSAGGTLTACFLASGLMATPKFQSALILASEVDLNRTLWPERPLDVAETASALLLEESTTQEGFAAFAFRSFPEHVGAIVSSTCVRDERPAVLREVAADLDAIVVRCITQTVQEFLAREQLPLAHLGMIVVPQGPRPWSSRLAEALCLAPERFVNLHADQEYGTSSLAHSFAAIRRDRLPSAPGPILVIEVAAGLQVGCALYYS